MRSLFISSLALALLSLAACSSDDGDPQSGRGTAKESEACSSSNDCAEPSAVCMASSKVCSGALDSSSFATECTAATAGACAGKACLVLNANKQNKTGLCSMKCNTSADCGSGGACVTVTGAGTVCLEPCTTSDTCENGFVCVPDPNNPNQKACLVEAS